MKVVGLTGGISTGKSTVSRLLSEHYPIIDADLIARQVVEPGKPAYKAILKAFSDIPDLLLEDGQLNRTRLGQVVFEDATRRRTLNRCTHPYIRRAMAQQILHHWIRGVPVVILDVPLLIEGGLDKFVSTVVVVDCAPAIQLKRLCVRDKIDEASARQRIDAQLSMEVKCRRADYIISNDGSLEELESQVKQLIQHIRPWRVWTWLCWIMPVGCIAALLCLVWRRIRSPTRRRLSPTATTE
jgi:dephospho-CoA kinase